MNIHFISFERKCIQFGIHFIIYRIQFGITNKTIVLCLFLCDTQIKFVRRINYCVRIVIFIPRYEIYVHLKCLVDFYLFTFFTFPSKIVKHFSPRSALAVVLLHPSPHTQYTCLWFTFACYCYCCCYFFFFFRLFHYCFFPAAAK